MSWTKRVTLLLQCLCSTPSIIEYVKTVICNLTKLFLLKVPSTLSLGKFKHEGFTRKNTSNVFRSHYSGGISNRNNHWSLLDFVFHENSVREITWLLWRHPFRKTLFSKCFPSAQKRKAGVYKFLKSFFVKLRFLEGCGQSRPNRRNKTLFSNFSSIVWTRPDIYRM